MKTAKETAEKDREVGVWGMGYGVCDMGVWGMGVRGMGYCMRVWGMGYCMSVRGMGYGVWGIVWGTGRGRVRDGVGLRVRCF